MTPYGKNSFHQNSRKIISPLFLRAFCVFKSWKIPSGNPENAPGEASADPGQRNSIGYYGPDKPAQNGLFAQMGEKIPRDESHLVGTTVAKPNRARHGAVRAWCKRC